MMNFYYMYHRSAKKWNELKAVSEILGEDILKPVRAQGTPWIDHRRKALRTLDRDYVCQVAHFQDVASGVRTDIPAGDVAKMKGYLMKMTSHEFVLHLAFYQDLVEDLAELSVSLQADNLALSAVRTNIEATTVELRTKLTKPGPRL
ncbi:hypothetical protein HOLleu_17687 [Holothuria leucospilota]|uniref:Uncharacterized protein n=1 Tax=Holothuria leucospilota TaxID=206669 RepID=A0A9Q1H8H7_HOLLE|nr:hypothetical protein HOLleu_17687 [Holothuria leucospilota]